MSTPPKPEPDQPSGDPSMEDILASIRRILSEDEQASATPPPAPDSDDVLILDPSMMVPEPTPPEPAPVPSAVTAAKTAAKSDESPVAIPPVEPVADPELVSPESARAAAASVAGLVATLTGERGTQIHRGGPTIEDSGARRAAPVAEDLAGHASAPARRAARPRRD